MAGVNNGDPVRRTLQERGAPEHIVRDGGEGLVRRWRQFVEQVEKGYPLGLDDYRNDLDIRTLIAFAGLDGEVSAEDARLRAVLADAAAERSVWESDVPGAFWVRGYPRNARGELRGDLISEGLAE
jgi:hypothetical protein